MNTKVKHERLLKILLITSICSTLIHFTDNYLYFEHYPQPAWITPTGVYRSWIIWTIFGIAGYVFYQRERFLLSYVCLTIYSFCGISSLGHYLYGGMSEFSPKMHILILTDGMTGLAILGFTIWSGLVQREKFKVSDQSI